MFLKNGTLIVGYWDHGFLHGRAIIFTPFGGKTVAQFYNGKLNGWAITIFAEKLVVCAIYYQNKIDGEKIIFQANQKIWVGSKYISDTNSFKIIHLQKGTLNQLPDFIKFSQATQLIDLYDEFINSESHCMVLKEIQSISITENFNYIGYCNQQGFPNGLGCIYGKKQFYMGHFREGSLQCFGRMIFQNGEIYQGQLLNGVFYGQGIYYNPSKNLSTIMSTNRQEQKIIDQQEGYICINSNLSYFKYIKQGLTGMIGDSLASICEIIEKYYSRFYIQTKYSHLDSYSAHSEFGVSQNADDIEELISKNQQSPNKKQQINQKNKSPRQKQQQKPWLNFKEVTANDSPQIKSQVQGSQQESSFRLHRVYSMDKREAAQHRKNLAQQSIPLNFQQKIKSRNKQDDQVLDMEIIKLKMDRNFSLDQKKSQNISLLKSKQNISPYDQKNSLNLNEIQTLSKRNTLNIGEKYPVISGTSSMTFRNIKVPSSQSIDVNEDVKERKYSHLVESKADFSPQESVISNLSHKVEGMMKNTSTKRKKIFM